MMSRDFNERAVAENSMAVDLSKRAQKIYELIVNAQEGEEKIIEALQSEELNKELVNAPIVVDGDSNQERLLSVALSRGHIKVAKLLLQNGASPVYSALHCSIPHEMKNLIVKNGYTKAVVELLDCYLNSLQQHEYDFVDDVGSENLRSILLFKGAFAKLQSRSEIDNSEKNKSMVEDFAARQELDNLMKKLRQRYRNKYDMRSCYRAVKGIISSILETPCLLEEIKRDDKYYVELVTGLGLLEDIFRYGYRDLFVSFVKTGILNVDDLASVLVKYGKDDVFGLVMIASVFPYVSVSSEQKQSLQALLTGHSIGRALYKYSNTSSASWPNVFREVLTNFLSDAERRKLVYYRDGEKALADCQKRYFYDLLYGHPSPEVAERLEKLEREGKMTEGTKFGDIKEFVEPRFWLDVKGAILGRAHVTVRHCFNTMRKEFFRRLISARLQEDMLDAIIEMSNRVAITFVEQNLSVLSVGANLQPGRENFPSKLAQLLVDKIGKQLEVDKPAISAFASIERSMLTALKTFSSEEIEKIEGVNSLKGLSDEVIEAHMLEIKPAEKTSSTLSLKLNIRIPLHLATSTIFLNLQLVSSNPSAQVSVTQDVAENGLEAQFGVAVTR
jgi:hypothetical protein